MGGTGPDPNRLLDEAIDLIIRLQNDAGNTVTLEMIKGWRARSAEHEKVWQKVAAAHGTSGKVLGDRDKAKRREASKITRRKFVIGGAVGVGAVAAGSVLIPDAIVRARADHITEKGEIRRIELADGSIATLGPESALALDFEAAHRGVELLMGMSYFEVAKAPARPFVVKASGLTALALGTAFDVSVDAGLVTVSVSNGLVETRPTDAHLLAASQLKGGDWLAVDVASRGVDRGTREVSQIAAWRNASIVAEREPVSVLVAKISRWYPGRVIVADPFIGSQKVSGVFDLSNPRRALEAVVHPAGGRVRELSSFLTIVSPI
jgi:transmembrane sensor